MEETQLEDVRLKIAEGTETRVCLNEWSFDSSTRKFVQFVNLCTTPCVTSFELSDIEFNDNTFYATKKLIAQNNLKWLCLDVKMTDDQFLELVCVLPACTKLRSLSIFVSGIIACDCWVSFFNVLPMLNLEILVIGATSKPASYDAFADAQVMLEFATVLPKLKLKELDMHYCYLTMENIGPIMNAIAMTTSLTKLDIADDFDNDTAFYFLEHLIDIVRLHVLKFWNVNFFVDNGYLEGVQEYINCFIGNEVRALTALISTVTHRRLSKKCALRRLPMDHFRLLKEMMMSNEIKSLHDMRVELESVEN